MCYWHEAGCGSYHLTSVCNCNLFCIGKKSGFGILFSQSSIQNKSPSETPETPSDREHLSWSWIKEDFQRFMLFTNVFYPIVTKEFLLLLGKEGPLERQAGSSPAWGVSTTHLHPSLGSPPSLLQQGSLVNTFNLFQTTQRFLIAGILNRLRV